VIAVRLPCPECLAGEPSRNSHVGNNRRTCVTCNLWAQALRRRTFNELRSRHPDELDEIRLKIEGDMYPRLMDTWGKVPA
jgi:hypothetical protein